MLIKRGILRIKLRKYVNRKIYFAKKYNLEEFYDEIF